jgi:hypothetical protein
MPVSSVQIALCAAVVGAVNALDLSQEFTAERCYQPIYDISKTSDLKVSVAPRSITLEQISRGGLSSNDYGVDVGVQKKLDKRDNDSVDPFAAFTEELLAALADVKKLESDDQQFALLLIENEPIYDPDRLVNDLVFQSVVSLTYRRVV